MIGKQTRDASHFCCIFEGRGGGGQFKSVQLCTAGGGGVMECEYIRSLLAFLLFFFTWKCADFTNS